MAVLSDERVCFSNLAAATRRGLAVLTLALASVLAVDLPVEAAGTIDQEQTLRTGTASAFAHSTIGAAQTLTGGLAGTQDRVDLLLRRVGNPGNLTVQVRTVGGDALPTAAILATGVVSQASVPVEPADPAWISVPLAPAFAVSAGTRYAIVILDLSGAHPTDFFIWMAHDSNPYASGEALTSPDGGATWAPLHGGGYDLTFRTYVLTPAIDADGDGVCNRDVRYRGCAGSDRCPGTPAGAMVDSNGCRAADVDADGDGVCNRDVVSSLCFGSDLCPGTAPQPTTVDSRGCSDAQNMGRRR